MWNELIFQWISESKHQSQEHLDPQASTVLICVSSLIINSLYLWGNAELIWVYNDAWQMSCCETPCEPHYTAATMVLLLLMTSLLFLTGTKEQPHYTAQPCRAGTPHQCMHYELWDSINHLSHNNDSVKLSWMIVAISFNNTYILCGANRAWTELQVSHIVAKCILLLWQNSH